MARKVAQASGLRSVLFCKRDACATVPPVSWLDKLEKRFGFLAIPGLIRAVVLFNVLVLGLVWLNPSFSSAIDLNPARILHGQVWRLVTYIFIPQTFSWWVVLFLWFLWFIGDGLERAWGAFKLTLYFFIPQTFSWWGTVGIRFGCGAWTPTHARNWMRTRSWG